MKEINTVKELLAWSYANLARAHAALDYECTKYKVLHHMVRAKLFKGLMNGDMSMRTIFDDEKVKILNGNHCSYCGSTEEIAIDHLIPRIKGGKDAGDNLIPACRRCNSSKGGKDLMEWHNFENKFPPLLIIRRYLKIVYLYCESNGLLNTRLSDAHDIDLPFNLELIPIIFPPLEDLVILVDKEQDV